MAKKQRYSLVNEPMQYRKYGWKILNAHKSKNGRMYVVLERPLAKDFIVGRGFDFRDGTWAQGEYGYSTRKKANNRAKYLARKYRY
jgi:hypothetical protein